MRLRVVQENETVADLPDYAGPVPPVGAYIFHPAFDNDDPPTNIAGCVRVVTFHLYERGPGGFVAKAEPMVEVTI